MSNNERFLIGCFFFYRAFLATTLLLIGLGCMGGCGGGTGDDDSNCTSDCRPDAGPMTTTDAKPTTPDANMTPDANSNACAQFAQPSPTGKTWLCTATNGAEFDCKNPTFVEDSGGCYALCEGGDSAGKVQTSDQTSTWHSFTTITPNTHFTCRPRFQS